MLNQAENDLNVFPLNYTDALEFVCLLKVFCIVWCTTEISETRDVTESSVQRQILRSGAFSCSAQTFDAGHWIQ